jgi:tRNA A37 threonylcarbamoyladenosine synthetase subunit TsaC/SUA5/YrdC
MITALWIAVVVLALALAGTFWTVRNTLAVIAGHTLTHHHQIQALSQAVRHIASHTCNIPEQPTPDAWDEVLAQWEAQMGQTD